MCTHPESTEQQNKYPPRKSKKKKKKPFMGTFPYVLFVLGVSFLISGFALITANDVLALVKPETTVIVEVPKEVSSGQMAKILKEEEVIKYPWAFKLYSVLKKTDKYKSGKFELDTGMDYGRIIDKIGRAHV